MSSIATGDSRFLAAPDCKFYTQLLEGGLLQKVTLPCARNAQSVITGFSGCSGNERDILLIGPLQCRKGLENAVVTCSQRIADQ